jgi:transcriptional regulator with XRE-family HTH domain
MQNMIFEILLIKDVKTDLGKLCKVLRKKQKLSQDELADLLSISRITIQNLESGKNVTTDTLLKVFQYFDILGKFNHFIQEEIKNSSYKSLY